MSYKIKDRVNIPGIGTGEIVKVRYDDRGDPIFTVVLDHNSSDYYTRDVEMVLLPN